MVSAVSGPRAGASRYLPAEDSYLLGEALESCGARGGGACLEIGFGTAAVLAGVSERFGLAVGTDVIGLPEARLAKAPRIEVVLADRASCFRDKAFDLVFFNPPYLPSGQVEDRAVDAGRGGMEVPFAFLDEALRVMKDDGETMVLLSDHGDLESFVSRCRGLGLSVERAAGRRLFFETLVVFRVRKRSRARLG